jgi:hypothetical protein
MSFSVKFLICDRQKALTIFLTKVYRAQGEYYYSYPQSQGPQIVEPKRQPTSCLHHIKNIKLDGHIEVVTSTNNSFDNIKYPYCLLISAFLITQDRGIIKLIPAASNTFMSCTHNTHDLHPYATVTLTVCYINIMLLPSTCVF